MIGLEIRFLTGRFHANPWHHAHNEGIAEWPPSPWRILRSLVAAAYELDLVAEAQELLKELQGLPRYKLPAAREAHLRHYMPDVDDASHTKAKVFDAFVVVDGGAFSSNPQPVIAVWQGVDNPAQRALLRRLAAHVRYLGRAESWAEMAVVDVTDEAYSCWPDERADGPSTTLMVLEPEPALAAWAQAQPKPRRDGARDVPRTAWDVLTFDAARFRDEGWSKVPGTRLAKYAFAKAPFVQPSILQPRADASPRRPTVARFAIRSSVLPRMTEALAVAERMRAALMSQSRRTAGDARPVFSGHLPAHEGAEELRHGHAFILPSSEGNDEGYVDHITVTARMGFDDDDIRALQSVKTLYGKGDHFLDLVLIGLGDAADYGGLSAPRSPLLASSRAWSSLTPFVPSRHPKVVRGRLVDDVPSQIRRACGQLELPEPIEVTPVEGEWFRYRRRKRSGGGRRGPDTASGWKLVFAEEVRGPIALGFGAHLGLGAFVASNVKTAGRT